MEKNIFENAKFGDKFICTNNKVGILVCCCETTSTALLMFADNYETYFDYSIKKYRLDGVCMSSGIKYDEFDVVSKYQEPIDEDLVEELNDKIEKYESELCELNAYKDSIEKYQKPIDENKLDELAKDYNFHNTKLTLVDGYGSELEEYGSSINAYKAGYRKAKEE